MLKALITSWISEITECVFFFLFFLHIHYSLVPNCTTPPTECVKSRPNKNLFPAADKALSSNRKGDYTRIVNCGKGLTNKGLKEQEESRDERKDMKEEHGE